jgi:hypothetical protein
MATPKLEKCQNCQRPIGALETPQVYKDHVVCFECYGRMAAQSTPTAPAIAAASTVSPPPPLDYGDRGFKPRSASFSHHTPTAITTDYSRTCTACGGSIAKNASTCPHCGRRFTTAVTWLVLGVIIFLFVLIVIGVAMRSG